MVFYCDLLDLHVGWKGPIDADRLGTHVGDDRGYLALFQAGEPGTVRQDYGRPGLNHFGFVVDDLEEARRRLERLGATAALAAAVVAAATDARDVQAR